MDKDYVIVISVVRWILSIILLLGLFGGIISGLKEAGDIWLFVILSVILILIFPYKQICRIENPRGKIKIAIFIGLFAFCIWMVYYVFTSPLSEVAVVLILIVAIIIGIIFNIRNNNEKQRRVENEKRKERLS